MVLSIIFLATLLGVSHAVDLTGCLPGPPRIYDALFQLAGDIYSPGYLEKQNYPDDITCEYILKAPFGFRYVITIKDLDVEPAEHCRFDGLAIIEATGYQELIGVYCGNETGPPILSRGHIVRIRFRSDFMVGRRGFHINFQITGFTTICKLGQKPCRNGKCYNIGEQCDGVDNCGDGTDEENCGFPLPTTKCGVRSQDTEGADRVIGGRDATPGSWPWQADLQLAHFHPNGHMCGGTLINAQWVLTAAHCFINTAAPFRWRIHLGNHKKYVTDDSEQIRFVERIIVYPGLTGSQLDRFEQPDMEHDLALLKLNAPVKFTDQVRPACLPAQGYELPSDTKCLGTGWGMTRGTGSASLLKEVDLWIEPIQVCTGKMMPIHPATMICVRNRKGFQDVCHGDSGGPLACKLNGTWYVLGATSFGTSGNFEGGLCALPESSTVYQKASSKTTWIQQQINKYS